MISSDIRPFLIIHSLKNDIYIKQFEQRYLVDNLEKPLEIAAIGYNTNGSIRSVSVFFRLSSITLDYREIEADIKHIKNN